MVMFSKNVLCNVDLIRIVFAPITGLKFAGSIFLFILGTGDKLLKLCLAILYN